VSAASGGEQHVGGEHRLTIVDEAYQRRLEAKHFFANSFHNHGLTAATLAPGLRPIAVTQGGIVEAVYHPNLPVVGMQWHPERPGSDERISSAFLSLWLRWCADACGAARGV
jgi:putative glutamine amidotransferase